MAKALIRFGVAPFRVSEYKLQQTLLQPGFNYLTILRFSTKT